MSAYGTATYDSATYDGVGVGDPVVELFLNGSWVNVTSYVRVADGIQIRRGRQDWSSSPTFATCDLTLDNRDGRFSPRNTSGAYYPYLVRNTPVRVSVYDDSGTPKVRFWGDVSAWPVDIVGMGFDLTTRLEASGLRRRLQQGAIPLASPYRIAENALTTKLAYWPMEDGDQATAPSSAMPGGAPMSVAGSGTYDPASDDTFVAATALPVFSGPMTVQGLVPTYTPVAGGVQIRMLLKCTATGGDGVDVVVNTSGAHYFVLEYIPATQNLNFAMRSYATNANEATNPVSGLGFSVAEIATTGVRLSIELKQNGTGIDTNVVYLRPGATGGASFGVVTIPSATLGLITGVAVTNGASTTSSTVVGHVTVENGITSIFDLAAVLTGYAGETAAARATRLATASGTPLVVGADAGGITTQLMGPQTEATFLELFDETAYVDGGVSTEDVATRALSFRPRSALYSQSPATAYGFTSLFDVQAVDDDQTTVNDVTATRTNGGSANYMVATGNLSVASIGDYASEYDLNVYADTQLLPQAQWRAAVGTVDEPRWPVLAMDAIRLNNVGGKRDLLIALREGDRLRITSVSNLLGSTGTIDALVSGWTETITDTAWEFVFNTVPGTPYSSVFVLDSSTFGILDTDRLAL